jgi:hypothetical protein
MLSIAISDRKVILDTNAQPFLPTSLFIEMLLSCTLRNGVPYLDSMSWIPQPIDNLFTSDTIILHGSYI